MDRETMRRMTCCFTGHRHISRWEQGRIRKRLEKVLEDLIQQGVRYFGAGGALGFDTLAAQTVLELRKQHPQIRLILVLPCVNQTRGWSEADIQVYEDIKTAADKITYTSQDYTPGCMHKRNRHLVDNSGVCVCYLKEATGGTAYTVKYAQQQGVPVINLAE